MSGFEILIVEDEHAMRAVLRDNLQFEGYRVVEAENGRAAMDRVRERMPDLIIMDIMMPVMDGIEATRIMREKGIWTPVVFLSARGDEIDRILALEIGGDDYITKPFSIRELLARIKVILRRAGLSGQVPPHALVGDRSVDFGTYSVSLPGGKRFTLSHLEARLLELLMKEKNKPVPRAKILDEVWGVGAYPTDRTVDNTVVRLRKKLEDDPKNPKHVLTVHGVGYKFCE